MNGALMLGIIYSITGFITIGMFIYFIKIKGNGLKSVLCHLFIAWSLHYLIIGVLTFLAAITGKEVVPLNTLRLVASAFVLIQFFALIRLYFYIIKK